MAPLGECFGIRDLQVPANVLLDRYCYGGSMAARLGSTDSLNTIVIAHPGNLTHDQIRAIKVNPSRCLFEDLRFDPCRSDPHFLVAGRRSIIIIVISRYAIIIHKYSLLITEDMGFKDKDVQVARDIFKKQEEKPDHVEYEFRVWKGNFYSFLI